MRNYCASNHALTGPRKVIGALENDVLLGLLDIPELTKEGSPTPQPTSKTSRKCVALLGIDTNMDVELTKKKRKRTIQRPPTRTNRANS